MAFIETVDGILISIVTGAIIFASQWLINWLRLQLPAGRVWGNFRGKRVEIVITTAPEKSPGEFSTLVFPTEAMAGSELQTYLTKFLTSDCRINFSESFPASKYDRNLVVVGGPVHNRVTSLILDKQNRNLGFSFDGHGIVLEDGSIFSADLNVTTTGVKEITSDIGVIVHMKNPLSKDAYLTLLLGSRTFGCLAAARALLHDQTKDFARQVSSFTEYAAVVSCGVAHQTVLSVKIERVWEIPK